MTKCVLGVENAEQLQLIASNLESHRKKFHLWNEQPENIPVALATAPGEKEDLQEFFKHLKLMK
jgi:Peptidyl-tRNA hydrolase PTH2